MPRQATLKPKKLPSRGKWCLNVPAELSPTGKRHRLFFDTEREAKAETEKLKARRDNFGVSLAAMTPARITEAGEAYKLLEPLGVGLLDAVREYVETHRQRNASITLRELFDMFLEAKGKRSGKYLTQLRWARDRMGPLHTKLVADITVRDLDAVLNGERPTVKNAFMRYLRALFNFGLKRDYLPTNPIAKLDFEEVIRTETQIFAPDTVAALLNDCLQNDLELLPFRVLGFFCGVRPDGELQRVEWSDLDWADRILKLRAEITKKKRQRFVEVSPNTFAWLEAYRQRGGSIAGRIVPFTPAELRQRHRANWVRVVGADENGKPRQRWIQQGMRHSYCSYWLVEHDNDVDTLVVQSGHESKEVMWASYYRATMKAKGKAFWSIMPPGIEDTKIVRLSA
jgi:integrase